ncbi:MAG: CRTAC1 family protein [Verrucomicrobiales bacterium]
MATIGAGLWAIFLLGGCDKGPDVKSPADSAAASAPPSPAWFEDATSGSGLHFTHDAGPLDGRYFFPQIIGSGCALLDFDGDGRLDVYFVQNAGPQSASTNRLFRQVSDGQFTDVSAGSGVDVAGHGMGAAAGDVNNDGRPDLLLTEHRSIRLFLNESDGRFADVTREAGLENRLWGTSAAFFDYDRDGWLDLVVANYVTYDPDRDCTNALGRHDYCSPKTFEGSASRLFHNLGRSPGREAMGEVRFRDVTLESGIGTVPGPGLGVTCLDFDGDCWPDVFIANDGKPNHLWMNQHDGTFKEEAMLRGVACNAVGGAEANMGIAAGDVDGDGSFDLFVTHLIDETHGLWAGGAGGVFRDKTVATGLASPRWRATGFGTVLADFTHDGALHLAIVNGGVTRGPRAQGADLNDFFWADYAQRNQLFVNDGTGRFRDVSEANAGFCSLSAVSRGLASGDLDNDGDLDLLVTAVAGPARLYRNVAIKKGHWVAVRTVDPTLGGRDAYGALVRVFVKNRLFTRWVNPGSSYLVSNDPRIHFGLGSAAQVDRMQVVWPDGNEEEFPGGPAGQYVTVRKGEGSVLPPGKSNKHYRQ